MRRKGHPSFPSAITCCFFSSLKTLLMPREPIRAPLGVNVPGSSLAGFQVTLFGRIWVTPEARLGICTRGSDLADDLDWHACLLTLLSLQSIETDFTYERAHPWHFRWQSAQSVIRLSIVSPPSWLLRFM